MPGSLLADGFAGAAFCDPPSFAAAGGVSERDRPTGCSGVVVAELLASPAELLSTSAPKISFPETNRTSQPVAARSGKARLSLLLT